MHPPVEPNVEKGFCVALIYALVAESLSTYYAHGQWLTEAQGAACAADWLSRNRRSMAHGERKALAGIAGDLARTIAGSLSRQAGLFLSHELTESLDPNYQSEAGQQIMAECERRFEQLRSGQEP